MRAIIITSIICITLVMLAYIGKDEKWNMGMYFMYHILI